ncbi:MAG: hypothetical protein IJ071_11180 [Ruminococcus sp.]|nr:hypothetical protein [Ruminococcus sp.]
MGILSKDQQDSYVLIAVKHCSNEKITGIPDKDFEKRADDAFTIIFMNQRANEAKAIVAKKPEFEPFLDMILEHCKEGHKFSWEDISLELDEVLKFFSDEMLVNDRDYILLLTGYLWNLYNVSTDIGGIFTSEKKRQDLAQEMARLLVDFRVLGGEAHHLNERPLDSVVQLFLVNRKACADQAAQKLPKLSKLSKTAEKTEKRYAKYFRINTLYSDTDRIQSIRRDYNKVILKYRKKPEYNAEKDLVLLELSYFTANFYLRADSSDVREIAQSLIKELEGFNDQNRSQPQRILIGCAMSIVDYNGFFGLVQSCFPQARKDMDRELSERVRARKCRYSAVTSRASSRKSVPPAARKETISS